MLNKRGTYRTYSSYITPYHCRLASTKSTGLEAAFRIVTLSALCTREIAHGPWYWLPACHEIYDSRLLRYEWFSFKTLYCTNK